MTKLPTTQLTKIEDQEPRRLTKCFGRLSEQDRWTQKLTGKSRNLELKSYFKTPLQLIELVFRMILKEFNQNTVELTGYFRNTVHLFQKASSYLVSLRANLDETPLGWTADDQTWTPAKHIKVRKILREERVMIKFVTVLDQLSDLSHVNIGEVWNSEILEIF